MKITFEINEKDYMRFNILEAVALGTDEKALSFIHAIVTGLKIDQRERSRDEQEQREKMLDF